MLFEVEDVSKQTKQLADKAEKSATPNTYKSDPQIGTKRVKFNKFIEQIDFLKQKPIDDDENDNNKKTEDDESSQESSGEEESGKGSNK